MSVLLNSTHPAEVMDRFLAKVSLECDGTTEICEKNFSDNSKVYTEYFYFSLDVFGHDICFSRLNIEGEEDIYSRIAFSYGITYDDFPYELHDDIIDEMEFDIMFHSVGNRVVLGNFFSRNSELRNSLNEVLKNQTLVPAHVLGAELWKIILSHGGLNMLIEIWEELFQLDIAYLMRLKDPYCFDERIEEIRYEARP